VKSGNGVCCCASGGFERKIGIDRVKPKDGDVHQTLRLSSKIDERLSSKIDKRA